MCRGIVEGTFLTFEPIGSIHARLNRRTQQRYSSEKRQRAPRGHGNSKRRTTTGDNPYRITKKQRAISTVDAKACEELDK